MARIDECSGSTAMARGVCSSYLPVYMRKSQFSKEYFVYISQMVPGSRCERHTGVTSV